MNKVIDLKLEEKKVIRDNIHGNIPIEHQIIWELINTDIFQRLRRVHQLGGTFMVFPGAEHSRFAHSLGVYNVVRRIIFEVESISQTLSTREKIIAMCAGLLHDIGHGPYSHAFEDVFGSDHEEMGIRMMIEDTSITKVLNQYDPKIASEVAAVIKKEHPNKILIQLISSQVDADRMDYLLRDAYNCGVSYGNFDLERLLRSMIVVDNQIAFKNSGVHAIEDYIFARYHMYWQVYLHPTANSFELILTKILRRFKELILSGYQFKTDLKYLKPFIEIDKIKIEDYMHLDESIINYYFREFSNEEDEILSELSHCFLERKLFKHRDIKNSDEGLELINKFETNESKQEYYFGIQTIKRKIYDYYGELNPQSILIKEKDGSIRELYDSSNLVNAIVESAKQKTESKLYFHQNYMGELYE
ncbi:MAG: HD domain-containing protein [Erysipelotrichales bacterium]